MDDIAEFLKSKKYPEDIKICKWKKRNFRRDCNHFALIGGVLHYKGKRQNKLVLNDEELDKVLDATHRAPHGGHLGVNKTYGKINERYYCKGLFNKVRSYLENCDTCQRKGWLKKCRKPLHPIPVSNLPFSKIGMDLIGPLDESNDGNKYILVFTEYLTKWVDAVAVPNKKAETILDPLIKFVCTHGVPDTLITDQGREFCNHLNEGFCKKMGIKHNVASPYHPQTGGQTERFNRTLSSMLVSYVNEKSNDWDSKLPYVLFAYRTAEHSTTKQDPFSLVFGRKARLPIELELPVASDKERVNAFLKLQDCRQDAARNIKKGQAKQKKNYDSKITKTMFNVGDEVLLHNTRKLTRKGGKLNPVWSGPYIVHEVLGNGCYRLNGKNVALNGNRLKAYIRKNRQQSNNKSSSNASANDTMDVKEDTVIINGMSEKQSTEDEKATTNTIVSSQDKKDTDDIICSKHNTIHDEQTAAIDKNVSVSEGERKVKRVEDDKSQERLSKSTADLSEPNKAEDDSFLPPKKRRKYKPEESENVSDDIILVKEETNESIFFDPVEQKWQNDKSNIFGINVRNYHKQVQSRPVGRNARPVDVAHMRGDGNCLFRVFSYLIFGVQTYHAEIRQRIIDFMIRHSAWFEGYVDKTLTDYLNVTEMWDDGRWGTDVEIIAFATLLKTNVFVYCTSGEAESYKWIKYAPIDSSSDSCVYIWHRNGDHYEPVLDVEEQTFSKMPYMPIGKYVPKVYWKHVSLETLEGALVDNYIDESNLQKMCPEIKCMYVHTYTDKHYQIPGTEVLVKEMDCNIFNILCDHESFADKVSTHY